jgi:hypothetical protein
VNFPLKFLVVPLTGTGTLTITTFGEVSSLFMLSDTTVQVGNSGGEKGREVIGGGREKIESIENTFC